MTPGTPYSPLVDLLGELRRRISAVVDDRRSGDPTADDPMRGFYVTDEMVDSLLLADVGDAVTDAVPSPATPATEGDRLRGIVPSFGLTSLDVRFLLVALAPDLDRRFEPLYGYLNDDVSRRRATIGLALELCGLSGHSAQGRGRFHPLAPLIRTGLLTVEEPERPFLSRCLLVPDRVTAYLLGDDTPDPACVECLVTPPEPGLPSASDDAQAERCAKALGDGLRTIYVRESRDGGGSAFVQSVLRASGLQAFWFTPGTDEQPEVVAGVLREARLYDRALVVTGLPGRPERLVRALSVPDLPVILVGDRPYDPRWSEQDPLVVEAPRQAAGDAAAWTAALTPGGVPGFDLADAVAPYRLGPGQIRRAAGTALALAALEEAPLTVEQLKYAARLQSTSGLERHARRIRPAVGWDDLVLPVAQRSQLHELALRARHRDRVLGEWRLSAGGGRGRGTLALFAGDSGTGKTLSAEVVAAELGLDLYVIQLSSVVDKYVGETEKNLERIFTEADRTDAVLLFDEADAVFGKRSEVKDSHDRYANLESAYLLQRLESFDGVAVLTTNLRANIDDAFTRRLDLVVDFPFPDAEQRLELWRHSLMAVPCAEETDPGQCAREFELSGGAIRSAVVTAAYAAAGRGTPVTSADLLEGARREYRKAGRLVLDDAAW